MTRDEICTKFLETIPFELYGYQEEALLGWFESPGGVMVCAPTGMGKTLIAEAAVFEALHSRQRLYYTTPLIALTDQKFRELQDLAEKWGFARDDVGLITGNRKVNPDALVRVVVAEILLNHLLSPDPALCDMSGVSAVVIDEFHNFNDLERGIVWELSLVLLPAHVRVLLLSATVGNPYDFARWLRVEYGRDLKLVQSEERRVPLEHAWVGDKLITEVLPDMVSVNDEMSRVPALVFCFNRDECWDVAERLKGLPIITHAAKTEIDRHLEEYKDDLAEGVGPKLKQMLIRGVGVHHAGVLPKHKEIVETLFARKLVPFVVCTETLAAGINLPARSVVLSTLMKGKFGEKKLVAPSIAHQIFGRAGRPQFDKKGHVFVLAHEDDVRLVKWRKKYDQIPANTKDPGLLRAKKDLERKKPTRSKNEQYWTEGQLQTLIKAGPAKLFSRTMIPYNVLIYMLTRSGTLNEVRSFIAKRFESPGRLATFREQLDFMLNNMAALGYL
ncbi:MAG: DEAD/DEAH box helicase, partial [Planctomycetes bacterium]|nr:DEAD/DEAH box helicase [Planctomycetota bacterium]